MLIVPMVVLAAAAYLVGEQGNNSYVSTAAVILKPVPGLPFSPDAATSTNQQTVAITTESQIVGSDAVTARANKTLKTKVVVGDGSVTSSVPSNTQIVNITFTATSIAAAQAGANTFAKDYLAYRGAEATTTQTAKINGLTAQAAAVQAQLTVASKAASAAVPAPEAAGQVQLFSNQLVSVQAAIADAKAVPLDPGSVLTPASLPGAPTGLSSIVLAAAGAVVGLLLGLLAAIWRELSDRRVRSRMTSVSGLPVLSPIATRRRSGSRGVEVIAPALRGAVLAGTARPGVVALACVESDRSPASLSLALARSLTSSGYRVTLVYAEPGAAQQPGGSGPGLTQVLRGEAVAHDLLVDAQGLRILPAGDALAEVGELLVGPRMTTLLEQLRADSDYVVLAAPSTASPSGLGLARNADAVVSVATDKHTTNDRVANLVQQADLLGVPLMGIAIVPTAALGDKVTSLPGTDRGPAESDTAAGPVQPAKEGAYGADDGRHRESISK